MKKLISILFAVLCLTLAALTVSAAEPGLEMLKVNPYGGEEADIDTVRWYETGGQYFLFLPADVDMNAAKLYFQAEETVLLDGKALENGGSAAAFTPGVHQLNCGTQRYSLTVCCSEALPAVFLQTESGSLDYIHASKENKEPGNIRVYENGVLTLDKALKQIKGRGNSTWYHLKKPYNIKFDKKTGLLGMDKAKKWTLLANYLDLTLLHNACGFELGEDFGLPYTSQYRWVDLYINGDYLGNYMSMYSAHALSDFAINYVNPLYAYSSDMLYENDSVMNGLYEAGSWAVHYWNADQNNYGTLPAEHPVSIVADTKANEKIRVYLSPAPDADPAISSAAGMCASVCWLPSSRERRASLSPTGN